MRDFCLGLAILQTVSGESQGSALADASQGKLLCGLCKYLSFQLVGSCQGRLGSKSFPPRGIHRRSIRTAERVRPQRDRTLFTSRTPEVS